MTTVTRTAGTAGSISITTRNSAGQIFTPVSTPTVAWYTDSARTLGELLLPVTGAAGTYTASWTGAQAPAAQATRYLKITIETALGVYSTDADDDISFLAAGALISSTDYTTRAAVKRDLGITDTDDDDAIDLSIAAASRYIDQLTGTTFYPVTETRRYAVADSGVVWTDRFVTTDGLIVKTGTGGTYTTTLTSSSYLPAPYSAATTGGAYDRIEVPAGTLPLDTWPSVEITATWGYREPPASVERACRLIAAQLFRRKDSPEYVAGTSEFGVVTASPRVDGMALMLLRPYIDPGQA